MCAADVNLIMPHVPHVITFIEQIAADPEHSDAVVGATCGLIGFVIAFLLTLLTSFVVATKVSH